MSVGLGLGLGWGYNTDHVTCSPVCLLVLGWGELTSQTVLSYVCGVGVVRNYNTDHVTYCPLCLWGWDGVELQHRPYDMLSCMSVGLGLGWGRVTTQTM